jgi:hypothetical protein
MHVYEEIDLIFAALSQTNSMNVALETTSTPRTETPLFLKDSSRGSLEPINISHCSIN